MPLVIGPVDRRKGPSREIEQANTHNEPAEYPRSPARVKTPPVRRRGPARRPGAVRYRARATLRSSHTGCGASLTTPSEPKTRKRSKERANHRSCVTASTVPSYASRPS